MFHIEGSERPHRHNQFLAGYLAMVAGLVNSSGVVTIGSFTSHVTGNVGRFADDLATGHQAAAFFALLMILSFFLGAFAANVLLESNVMSRTRAYGSLLFLEASLLGVFLLIVYVLVPAHPRVHDALAMLLCLAMGLQNSLVTRLSGAVIRTTHLTGVVTDLGIESARWFRYFRAQASQRAQLRFVLSSEAVVKPSVEKTQLLLTIAGSFLSGSVVGASLAAVYGFRALLLPLCMVYFGSAFALKGGAEVPGLNLSLRPPPL